MSKSHVAMEQHQCPICLTRFDTGNILLETRFDRATGHLRQTLDDHQLTGHSPCKDCQAKLDEGYIALVETQGSPRPGQTRVGLDVPRSGNLVWLRRTVFDQVFDQPAPALPMIFIEPGVIEKLQAMQAPE